ncbi:organic solute transporter Ostalpha-domain-containing protein [Lipomyces arxii]|uniref:organic solute transporter Ostalpha-domain-containing protein n=1 Tax=Lipomyces arxii TaxID=56418 RepID=UPI0034CEA875
MSDLAPQPEQLPSWLITITGMFASAAAITTMISIYMHAKNYRKPLLQRFVVRIQFLIPIYALSAWTGLVSHRISIFIEPIKDMYEAFVIYQFLWLLTNYLGGERNLIITMYGQPPKEHLPPFRRILPKVDISDPHTFLAIKRGVLQYAWLKPVLAVIAFMLKAIGVYQEGYISVKSGYLWMGLIYNVSVSTSLYCLALFWLCLAEPLTPFRPVPKFLCIKLILFAAYWQGITLSVLVWVGVIKDVGYYTPNNVARVVQNVLMCIELLFFAFGHWSAFSWKDYADDSIGSARMPVYYALRDAFGLVDIIADAKDTFVGEQYQYRLFDSAGAIEHPDSAARLARLREGLRYQRQGEGRYWLPRPSARRPDNIFEALKEEFFGYFGSSRSRYISLSTDVAPDRRLSASPFPEEAGLVVDMDEDWTLDKDTEDLFKKAKAMRYGDYNYPVITVNESLTYTPLIKKMYKSDVISQHSRTPSADATSSGSAQSNTGDQRCSSTFLIDLESGERHEIDSPWADSNHSQLTASSK